MPTFKAEVQRHQLRLDGTYPVSIRVTHLRRSARIPTGIYVSAQQINKKSFEVKDSAVIERMNYTIKGFKEKLLQLSYEDLQNMTVYDLKEQLVVRNKKIDYLEFISNLAGKKPERPQGISTVLKIINDMGYTRMSYIDINSKFVSKFRNYIDTYSWEEKTTGKTKKYTAAYKNTLLSAISGSFTMMKKEYNSDFDVIIKHNLTIEFFKNRGNKKKAMDRETIRKILFAEVKKETQRLARDICTLSFGMCGINIIDLVRLKKTDYIDGIVTWGRGKTGFEGGVKIPTQLVPLFESYLAESGDRLFDFGRYSVKPEDTDHLVSAALGTICKREGIEERVTPYWFRHSFATIARNVVGATKDDVDLCLAHAGNNKMADVYIKNDWKRCTEIAQAVIDYVYKEDNASPSHDEEDA